MKVQVLSDLHIEFDRAQSKRRARGGPLLPPSCFSFTAADAVVLVGDIDTKMRGLDWAHNNLPERTVIYVAGNHDYWGGEIPHSTEKMRKTAKDFGIYFLENESIVIQEVAFLGCTLWTDLALYGNQWVAASEAQQRMNDYKKVRSSSRQYRKLLPQDTVLMHKKSIEWLHKEVERHRGRKIVVITHHAPSLRSVPDRFKNDPLSAAYASPLDTFIEQSGVQLWIHGHVHDSADYSIGSTRVLCNPRGYFPDEINPSFQPDLVVEV